MNWVNNDLENGLYFLVHLMLTLQSYHKWFIADMASQNIIKYKFS